jgi:hypothetical protein
MRNGNDFTASEISIITENLERSREHLQDLATLDPKEVAQGSRPLENLLRATRGCAESALLALDRATRVRRSPMRLRRAMIEYWHRLREVESSVNSIFVLLLDKSSARLLEHRDALTQIGWYARLMMRSDQREERIRFPDGSSYSGRALFFKTMLGPMHSHRYGIAFANAVEAVAPGTMTRVVQAAREAAKREKAHAA